MILQSSIFLVIDEGLQCATLGLRASVHTMMFQLTTPQKAEVFFDKKTFPRNFEKNQLFKNVFKVKKNFFRGASLPLKFCLFVCFYI